MPNEHGKDGSAKRLRFSADDDLALLKEFISQNPLKDAAKWEIIQKNVYEITGKKFSIRTLKDHLFLLLEIWMQKDADNQKKSGIEEMYSERDHLLQEVSSICENTNAVPKSKRKKVMSKEQQIAKLGQKARDNCARQLLLEDSAGYGTPSTETANNSMPNISVLDHNYFYFEDTAVSDIIVEPTEVTTTVATSIDEVVIMGDIKDLQSTSKEQATKQHLQETPRKMEDGENSNRKPAQQNKRILGPNKIRNNKSAGIRKNALDYLNNKEQKEHTIKIKELELEERKLQLEERKIKLEEEQLEMEKNERKERLDMDKERFKQEMFERNQNSKLLEYQQQLVDSLMDRLKKYEGL